MPHSYLLLSSGISYPKKYKSQRHIVYYITHEKTEYSFYKMFSESLKVSKRMCMRKILLLWGCRLVVWLLEYILGDTWKETSLKVSHPRHNQGWIEFQNWAHLSQCGDTNTKYNYRQTKNFVLNAICLAGDCDQNSNVFYLTYEHKSIGWSFIVHIFWPYFWHILKLLQNKWRHSWWYAPPGTPELWARR